MQALYGWLLLECPGTVAPSGLDVGKLPRNLTRTSSESVPQAPTSSHHIAYAAVGQVRVAVLRGSSWTGKLCQIGFRRLVSLLRRGLKKAIRFSLCLLMSASVIHIAPWYC